VYQNAPAHIAMLIYHVETGSIAKYLAVEDRKPATFPRKTLRRPRTPRELTSHNSFTLA